LLMEQHLTPPIHEGVCVNAGPLLLLLLLLV
jgi:hypothetical protein